MAVAVAVAMAIVMVMAMAVVTAMAVAVAMAMAEQADRHSIQLTIYRNVSSVTPAQLPMKQIGFPDIHICMIDLQKKSLHRPGRHITAMWR